MRSDIHWVEAAFKGRLGIMARPRSGDWLSDEVGAWHDDGVTLVVSLLERDEVEELDLEGEAELCIKHGIEFISFPIRDREVPTSFEAAASLARLLADRINDGGAVAVHCRAGIGRSALVAASALVCSGFDPIESFNKLSKARGVKVPDTDGQHDWVVALGRSISKELEK